MFENTRTKSKSRELRAHDTESFSEAKTRLETAGWVIPASASMDEKTRVISIEKETEEDE